MKKRIVSLVLLLCIVLSVFSLASCGKKKPATTQRTEEASATATTAATTDKWDVYGPEVTALSESSRRFKVEYSQFIAAEKIAKNDVYIKGPDVVEEGTTPTLDAMVYERNQTANELFGTSIEYVAWDYDKSAWGKASNEIKTIVSGHAADAPDLFVNMIYDLNLVLKTTGAFKDVWSIPGSYFDFEADGWMTDWMKNMSFTGDRAYVLAGDYFLEVLRAMGVLPFNMTMMDANADKLAPALIGETMNAGEELTTRFFDLVEQGGWTWELLGKICEAIWEDGDGDGQNSINDRLGIICDCYGGVSTSVYIYSAGEELIDRHLEEDPESPNYGKTWIYYPENPGVLSDIFDAVASVFSGRGAFTTTYKMDGSTPDQPGLAYHHIKFGQGELLTAGACLLGELEDVAFQNMQDLFSVVPMPKVNGESDYNTFVTNTGDAGAINVNTDPEKARVISAYVQYCTENSADIRDEFLEIVMKYKNTTYDQGTDRMLNLIYEHVRYSDVKVIEDAIGGNDRWHQIMKNGRCLKTSADLASNYKSVRDSKQAELDKIITAWYSLPGGKTAASTETPAGD